MVSSSEPDYPKGFRDNTGIEPEPRLGLAYDLTGDSKTGLHASVGLYHNPHVNANGLDAMARNPPAQNTPSIIYGTMDTLLAVGSQGAFSNRPSAVFGIQRDAPTPKSYNYSVGVQRELGWGTVIDVTYAGFQMRDAEMNSNINTVPDGARFLDQNPQNANPQNPTTPKPAEFLRPYKGYQQITMREHFGTASYNALQMQLNRRYINGLQFAVAYTYGKTVSDGTDFDTTRPGAAWNEGPDAATQFHNLVINYTWDIPSGSRMWDNWLTRGALDGWQLSGDTAFVSGDWAGATTSTSDNFDFTGGDGGTRPDITGDPMCTSGNCDVDAGRRGKLFQYRGIQPSLRTRRHRQRAGHLLPAAEDRAVQHVDLQELPARRRTPHSDPLGGVQRLQPGELVDAQRQRAIQSGRRAGQRELRPGDRGARRPRHAGGDSVLVLGHGDSDRHRQRHGQHGQHGSRQDGQGGGRAILPILLNRARSSTV